MRIKLLPLLLVFLFLSSCSKDNLRNIDYFAFGEAYGFCQGDCANFFLIEDDNIYPDDMDRFASSLIFKEDALPVEIYYQAKNLIDDFPAYLKKNPDKTFGCPDCADQGGIHIEIQENGKITRWHFDTNIERLPPEIQDYVEEIKFVLENLR